MQKRSSFHDEINRNFLHCLNNFDIPIPIENFKACAILNNGTSRLYKSFDYKPDTFI